MLVHGTNTTRGSPTRRTWYTEQCRSNDTRTTHSCRLSKRFDLCTLFLQRTSTRRRRQQTQLLQPAARAENFAPHGAFVQAAAAQGCTSTCRTCTNYTSLWWRLGSYVPLFLHGVCEGVPYDKIDPLPRQVSLILVAGTYAWKLRLRT